MAADSMTDEEIDLMFTAKVLGPHSASSLLHSLWFINSVQFGIRTGQEARNLKWGDIHLKEKDGESYLIYSQERQTKTRTGLNPRDVRKTKPRAYSIPDQPDRNPVELYKLYSQKRPEGFSDPDSPFYLGITVIDGKDPGPEHAWYKKKAMGLNRIYDIMNRLKEGSGKKSTDKRLTCYSARKHLMQKLSDKGVLPNQIIQISGHKNVNSLNNYSKLNPNQCRNISHILSNNATEQPDSALAITAPPTSSIVTSSSSSATLSSTSAAATSIQNPTIPPSLPGIFVGNEIHGSVHVHFHQAPQLQQSSSTLTTENQYQVVLPLLPDLSSGLQCSLPQTVDVVSPTSVTSDLATA